MTEKTLIIAEAGVNHNGDPSLARELVIKAAQTGADVVKFQTFAADRLVTRAARKAEYQMAAMPSEETQYDMLKHLELSKASHEELITLSAAHRIEFLSTAFDLESFALLESFGLKRIKIPSGEITNLPYLRAIGAAGKEVILSTGMSSLGEIEAAIDVLEKAGTSREHLTVLHCTTEYPAPMPEVNLRAMETIRSAFGVKVGYSDHTEGIEVAIAAVALGASVIEKHLTLDRTLPGPDHAASLDPIQFQSMVTSIRNVEIARGDGIKRPSKRELANIGVARKSIVAARAISAGEVFTSENLTTKRPGTGVSPMVWDEVIGRRAPRNFAENELIDSRSE